MLGPSAFTFFFLVHLNLPRPCSGTLVNWLNFIRSHLEQIVIWNYQLYGTYIQSLFESCETHYMNTSDQLLWFDRRSNFYPETSSEVRHESWYQPLHWSQSKNHSQHSSSIPSQLPARADIPSCAGKLLSRSLMFICAMCLSLCVCFFLFGYFR